jgi:F0F1-type ATP synthase membrane subunit b/b'
MANGLWLIASSLYSLESLYSLYSFKMDVLAKLGIDINSVIIYLVNFGILLAAVAYFVTGPVLKLIEKRQKTIKDNIEEAERLKEEFVAEKQKADVANEALKTDMEQQMSNLKKELDTRRKEQEEALETRKAKMLEEVRTIVATEKAGILKSAETQTLELIEKVVHYVVSNNVPQDIVKNSVQEAWKKVNG